MQYSNQLYLSISQVFCVLSDSLCAVLFAAMILKLRVILMVNCLTYHTFQLFTCQSHHLHRQLQYVIAANAPPSLTRPHYGGFLSCLSYSMSSIFIHSGCRLPLSNHSTPFMVIYKYTSVKEQNLFMHLFQYFFFLSTHYEYILYFVQYSEFEILTAILRSIKANRKVNSFPFKFFFR